MTQFYISTGDALVEISSLPPESVAAFVTDPPYCAGGIKESARKTATGQGLRSKTLRSGRFAWFEADNMGTAGITWLLRETARLALLSLRPGGSFLVFLDWRMVPSLIPAIESAGLRWVNLLVWDKGSMGLGKGFRCRHELIGHFTKGVGDYSAKDAANVLSAKRPHHTKREHPTEKPVSLLRDLIRVVTPPKGIVVDPFAGSGSVGVAAVELGRDFFGVERAGVYADIAKRRIAQAGGILI